MEYECLLNCRRIMLQSKEVLLVRGWRIWLEELRQNYFQPISWTRNISGRKNYWRSTRTFYLAVLPGYFGAVVIAKAFMKGMLIQSWELWRLMAQDFVYSEIHGEEANGLEHGVSTHSWAFQLLLTGTGDGSKEWTPEWMSKLDHRFGDDGAFWMSYDDLLKKYQTFDRTRLFSDDWKVTQQWTSLTVPWTVDYHATKFSFTLEKTAPVVLILSQVSNSYFRHTFLLLTRFSLTKDTSVALKESINSSLLSAFTKLEKKIISFAVTATTGCADPCPPS